MSSGSIESPQIRVHKNHVDRITKIVLKDKEETSSSFASVANEAIKAGLPIVEKKRGIKSAKSGK